MGSTERIFLYCLILLIKQEGEMPNVLPSYLGYRNNKHFWSDLEIKNRRQEIAKRFCKKRNKSLSEFKSFFIYVDNRLNMDSEYNQKCSLEIQLLKSALKV